MHEWRSMLLPVTPGHSIFRVAMWDTFPLRTAISWRTLARHRWCSWRYSSLVWSTIWSVILLTGNVADLHCRSGAGYYFAAVVGISPTWACSSSSWSVNGNDSVVQQSEARSCLIHESPIWLSCCFLADLICIRFHISLLLSAFWVLSTATTGYAFWDMIWADMIWWMLKLYEYFLSHRSLKCR